MAPLAAPDDSRPAARPPWGLPPALALWILFFCYATVGALLLQKLLLPLAPSLHLGNGLMQADSVSYHSYALALADAIREHGWTAWALYPAPSYTGNVAVLGALYALFGPDPSLLVPITAAVHAGGGVLVYLIARRLLPGSAGSYGGIAAAVAYVVLPSALTWYGQPLKDAFSNAGVLLLLYSWIAGLDRRPSAACALRIAAGTAAATALIVFVRPHTATLAFAGALVMLAVVAAGPAPRGWRWRRLLCFVPAVLVLAAAAPLGRSAADSVLSPQATVARPDFHWTNSARIPDALERPLEAAASFRASFIALGQAVNAGSMIDTDARPASAGAVFAYLPRALEIALFAPFPPTWPEKVSLTRSVGAVEIALWYLAIPGLVLALRAGGTLKLGLLLAYAIYFLAVTGFLNPNLGTLHRMRYPFLQLLMLAGTLGWAQWLLALRPSWAQWHRRPEPGHVAAAPDVAAGEELATPGRAGVARAGLLVIVLTLLANLGFFVRDLLMARQFGLGDELDAFAVAMMVPMFLVTVLSVPLGTAVVPAFLHARGQGSQPAAHALVARIGLAALTASAGLAVVLWLVAAPLLAQLVPDFGAAKLERAVHLMGWALLILAASAAVVLGNGVLNALQRFALPAWAQATVPVFAIAALLGWGERYGAAAVMAGMFAGQLANLALVAFGLRRAGVRLLPGWPAGGPPLAGFAGQYLPLAAAAFFMSAAAPIGLAMAAALPAGSVASLNIGGKIVLFVTGIVGAGISAVILPYFSVYLARERRVEAQRELSFFLIMGTLCAVPVSIAFFLGAKPLTALALAGSAVTPAEIQVVTKIMKFGIVQLPLFTCNVILLRFAVASDRAGRIMLVSCAGLAMNVVLNLVLMGPMGVAGIALATTLALVASATLMLVVLHRLGDVPWLEVSVIALTWMLFLTLMLCLYYQSPAGVAVAAAGMAMLLATYWREAAA